jgi:hypothetical protein
MTLLGRLPAWATSGVGSLPHTNVEQAVAHVAAAYDVPFCPQLPRLEGDMVTEWLGPDCGWTPERDRERPRAWDAFLRELDARPPAHRVVKLQVTGPVTLATALEDPELVHELATWLAANAAAQVRTLQRRGLDALLIVDEPALHRLEVDAWDPLRAIAPAWGLHVCGPVPWALVDAAEPDVLSFDLALAAPDRAVLRRIERRGGRVAWGIIEPHKAERAGHGLRRLRAVDPDPARSLLTAACGSGRTTVAREHEIASALAAIQNDLGRPSTCWPM